MDDQQKGVGSTAAIAPVEGCMLREDVVCEMLARLGQRPSPMMDL